MKRISLTELDKELNRESFEIVSFLIENEGIKEFSLNPLNNNNSNSEKNIKNKNEKK